jgi:light-regulated signal transduction histidine kinase (bacteriophytochrome)
MAEIARRAFADLDGERKDRRVAFTIGDLPDARGDPRMLGFVFRNLISNALKFTRERDEAMIEVGSERQNGGGPDQTVYFVRDNGAGFDMRYVDKLFEVFQRLHSSDEYEGTGIGLATVERIVHRHGGRIWAQGEVGKGATFHFTLEEGGGSDG